MLIRGPLVACKPFLRSTLRVIAFDTSLTTL